MTKSPSLLSRGFEGLGRKGRALLTLAAFAAITQACDQTQERIHNVADAADAGDASDAGTDASDAGTDGVDTDGGLRPGECDQAVDIDCDGFTNDNDTCESPDVKDPLDRSVPLDSDHDGVQDACELPGCEGDPDVMCVTERFDGDNDGIADGVDNCMGDINPDQSDRDGDHVGDACDCAPDDASVKVQKIDLQCLCNLGETHPDGLNVGLCIPSTNACESDGNGGTVWVFHEGRGPSDEVSDGEDNDCDGIVDNGFPCRVGDTSDCGPNAAQAGVGKCVAGKTTCTPEGWTVCDGAVMPDLTETLNRIDDDCDGQTDEDFNNLGCDINGRDGTQHIYFDDEGNPYLVCRPEVPFGPERCNGVDDDGDDEIDGQFPVLNSAVDALKLAPGDLCPGKGVCASQRVLAACSADGLTVTCAIAAPGAEECGNEEDDDCDGLVNEGCGEYTPGEQVECGKNEGVCQKGHLVADETGHLGQVCVGEITGQVELCDGVDNDCDGVNDNGFNLNAACPSVNPGCPAMVRQCKEDGSGTECIRVTVDAPELCDGLDNDCDGQIDNADFPRTKNGQFVLDADGNRVMARPSTATTTVLCTGLEGICADVVGTMQCDPNNKGIVVCSSDKLAQAHESCDSVDNDCDGQIDEDNGHGDTCDCVPGTVEDCGNNLPAPCKAGSRTCDANGQFGDCEGEIKPTTELCDGVDNDCDGTPDNGFNLSPNACAALGPVDICQPGTPACTQDHLSAGCIYQTVDTPDIQDGINNDCDLQTDENSVSRVDANNVVIDQTGKAGQACTGLEGACAGKGGEYVAVNGGLYVQCTADITDDVETPDAVDNDCDGQVDEDFDCVSEGPNRVAPRPCNDRGLPQPCHPGTQACVNGRWGQCVGEQAPVVENPCGNAIDDNCNGVINEPVGDACRKTSDCSATGGGILTADGVQVCVNGVPTCNATQPVCPPAPAPAPATMAQ